MLARDDVIRMAREAGFIHGNDSYGEYVDFLGNGHSVAMLQDFASAAYAAGQHAERYECASICENDRLNEYAVTNAGGYFAEQIRNRK